MISILVIALTIVSLLMIYAVRLICRRDRQARNFARLTELTMSLESVQMKKSDWSKWGREARAMQTESPRPKVLRPCPKCGNEFGARELRQHKPRCEGRKVERKRN